MLLCCRCRGGAPGRRGGRFNACRRVIRPKSQAKAPAPAPARAARRGWRAASAGRRAGRVRAAPRALPRWRAGWAAGPFPQAPPPARGAGHRRAGAARGKAPSRAEAKTLTQVLRNYGEIKTAKRLSDRILNARTETPILYSDQLKALVHGLCPPDKENRFLAQVFQAIRIAINDEMGALKDMLEACAQALAPGGMLVIMSYHSLEDRLVKHYLRAGNWEGRVETDLYGKPLGPFELITRSAIKADAQEQEENPRSRSVRLRIARKRP